MGSQRGAHDGAQAHMYAHTHTHTHTHTRASMHIIGAALLAIAPSLKQHILVPVAM